MMRSLNADILKLAVPSILANITVPLVGMVDIAVAGNLGAEAATMIGGIAVGSMLFDLLYWNFGFLRVGTGGLTAQAFGRGDMRESARIFIRAVGISLACALVLIAVQWLFVKGAFLVVDCSPQVRELASRYFFIRIWAAPATLSLMAFKGWFIGMQDSVSPMVTDIVVNGMNIAASIVLALGIPFLGWKGLGFSGIAAGTVMAQYTGLLTASLIMLVKYRRKVFAGLDSVEIRHIFAGGQTRRFFVMNADLFVRSLCFIAIYIGFTTISAGYGDLLLATGSIMMKLLMIFSYFTDGFAYAAEALTGRYIGAGDGRMLRRTVLWTFVWSMGLAALFMAIYQFGGEWMLRVMTSDESVVMMAADYLPWLLLMPLAGCAAFTWDGIYIGATASRKMRDSMLWATVAFFAVYFAGLLVLDSGHFATVQPVASDSPEPAPVRHDIIAMHILMAAYFAHLLARTIHLTLNYRRSIIGSLDIQ